MDREIVEYRPLVDLLAPLPKGQREYLYYRLLNLPKHKALRLAQRKTETLKIWENDPNFLLIEERVIRNREAYAKEAFSNLMESYGPVAQRALGELLEMALEWEAVPRALLPYVARAVFMVSQVGGGGDKGTYEERVFRYIRKEG